MQSKTIRSLRGYVRVAVKGGEVEQLLNLATDKGMAIWDIQRKDKQLATMEIGLPDYRKLRPLLKQTSCRTRVLQRYGLPFWVDKVEHRIFFLCGLVMFVACIYLLSSVVWTVQVDGNEQLSRDEVLQVAREHGVYPFQWKFKMKAARELSRSLTSSLPGVAWVNVEVKGTKVTIQIIEQTKPDPKPLLNPRHLIAQYDAVVTDYFVEQGKPVVERNQHVKKGDVLVSGLLGEGNNQQIVVAKGEVMGLVWHEYTIQVPLTQVHKVYTGNMKGRSYLVIGNRALQITGYGKLSFESYETEVDRRKLHWRNFVLPFGWIHETLRETESNKQGINSDEAHWLGLKQARKDVQHKAGEKAKIVGEKILHEKIVDGKVYMKVLFEVNQSISAELPIVKGD